MDDQQDSAGNGVGPSKDSSEQEMRKTLEAEMKEMERYKWCLGVQLRHDPLQDRSLNDIYTEWIEKYAAVFRKEWEEKNKSDAGCGPATP